MYRSYMTGFLAGMIGLTCVSQAAGQQLCRPSLELKDVQFAEMQPPTLERRWSAVVSVDASSCAANSQGRFEVVFSRLKEIGLEVEVLERFTWVSPSVNVSVEFWADEAVEVKGYWIDNITQCPCAR
jgi:hypothetical protein